MKKKYEILNFNLKELDLLKKHLNKMAKDHWHLKWISNYVICYEYNESKIHYYIDYNQFSSYDKDKEENRIEEQNQINFYNDLGYEFVCSFDNYSIYKSETLLEEIHTNEEIQNEVLEYVKNRTIKYNIYILVGYALFLFFVLYAYRKEFLHSFLDFTWPVYIISLFIAIYFAIQDFTSKRKIELKDIKNRTKIHLVLRVIQCILLFLFTVLAGVRFHHMFILLGYYSVYNTSNLLYFNSVDKKYKHVPFITNKLPYIIIGIIMLFFVLQDDYLDIYSPYNENYPQTIINTELFINNPNVEHYNEDESIALHMIECRVVNYDEKIAINLYYYNDKTHLLRPFILNYFRENSKHFSTKYIDTIDDIEIRSVNEDILEKDYEKSDLIFIKNHQYVRVRMDESFTKDTIHQLINAINWK